MEVLDRGLMPLFDQLLWISIQSSVLIILILLVRKVFRDRFGIRWHYLLWFLLLIRLAIPWLPESKISIFNLIPNSIQQGRFIESISKPQNDRYLSRYYLYDETSDAQEVQAGDDSETAFVGFMRKLPVLWLIGVLVMACYVCVRNIILWLTVKRERPITNQEILDLLEDCKMEMGVQTIIGVVVSDKIKSPALFGFVRPRLLLPQGLLETYSLDELAHLKQRDIYFGWLMALLQIAHWFNPLMWFAFVRVRADRELACDGLAISILGPDEPLRYGQTIVNLLENFSQVRYVPSVAGILEDKSQIERRIKMIADYKKTSRSRWAGAMLLIAVLGCVVLTNSYIAKADFTFSTPTKLGPAVNSPAADSDTSISTDGLELFFEGRRPEGYGSADIYVSTRATKDDPWGEAVNLGPIVNGPVWDTAPDISADGLTLYFSSTRSGSWDIWITTRATKNDPWEEPVNLGSVVNSSLYEAMPDISPDGLTLFFCDFMAGPHRPGGYGGQDIWVTTRATKDDPWGEPVNLGPTVNSSPWEFSPNISADGTTFYFTSDRGGTDILQVVNIWQVRILPVVDFNGDGIVDGIDAGMMVDYWHTDEPMYDIAPMPFGDGIVDVKDLVLLSEHLTVNMDEPDEANFP